MANRRNHAKIPSKVNHALNQRFSHDDETAIVVGLFLVAFLLIILLAVLIVMLCRFRNETRDEEPPLLVPAYFKEIDDQNQTTERVELLQGKNIDSAELPQEAVKDLRPHEEEN